jgi:hypothetical protein
MKPNFDSDFISLRSAICDDSVSLPEAMVEALRNPIEYPSVDLAFVPGDRLVIALHESLPNPFQIATPVLDWLIRQLAEKQVSITLVIPKLSNADNSEAKLPDQLRQWLEQHHPELSLIIGSLTEDDSTETAPVPHEVIRVVYHSPDDAQSLEYIAASDAAEPMYLQRELVEADFVIPIYRWLEPSDPRSTDPFVVLPAFADRSTQQYYAKRWLLRTPNVPDEEINHQSGWLLGVQFTIAIVLNHDGDVGLVAAGNPERVAQACSQAVATKPTSSSLQSLELVVVRILGGGNSAPARSPTWDEVASAAWIAEKWLTPTGRIVVVAERLDEVTEGINALSSDAPDAELTQELLNSTMEHAFSAAILRSIQSRRSVYLQSQISTEILESLGFASIEYSSELERLIQSVGRVGVLEY